MPRTDRVVNARNNEDEERDDLEGQPGEGDVDCGLRFAVGGAGHGAADGLED